MPSKALLKCCVYKGMAGHRKQPLYITAFSLVLLGNVLPFVLPLQSVTARACSFLA